MSSPWPHQFISANKREQVGPNEYIEQMVCIHCNTKWLRGKEYQPSGPCPARTDSREMKRIKS